MPRPVRRPLAALFATVLAAAAFGACGSSGDNSEFDGSAPAPSTGDGSAGDATTQYETGSLSGDTGPNADASQSFDVQPASLQTISVAAGQSTPTVVFHATANGQPVSVAWSVDRGDLGAIGAGPSDTGTFTPSAAKGGLVTISAGRNGRTLKRQVFIQLTLTQNGATAGESGQVPQSPGQLGAGGGVGGVGGEGLGGPAPNPGQLQPPSGDGKAQNLRFLYPYDKTVFPRGLLAPLLQWDWSVGDADEILIKLATTSGSFSWTGTFGRPAILQQTGGKFIRHPIPQDVWQMATETAGGPTPNGTLDQLTVSVVVASGGKGYGPIQETWTIAPGRLAGTVYYNSYGTQLVKNSIEKSYNNGPQFGAAVLSITQGATGPSVVAGTPSPVGSGAGCRVCHTVSSDGSRLLTQHGDDYSVSSAYDLKNANAETVLTGYNNLFGWAGLSPDGKVAFTNAADLAANAPASRLYTFPPTSSTPLPATGIPANLLAGTPTFSPNGKHVAFDFISGTIGNMAGDGQHLVGMDFDPSTDAFTNLKILATLPSGKRAGFPSFFPTNDAVAFHYQVVPANHRYNTWKGAEAQIWWSDLGTGNAVVLGALNGIAGGTTYLPTGPNNHGDDTVLNYEPTVNPIASGGYAWVVFTSRRLYGSVATTDPWQSDPRNYDATLLANTTTKKLWVAAIDLNAKPGTDPSHPAFYLPAQELLAGNARGFWVLDPCRPDGQSCQSGDQCCNGYCEPGGGDGGALVCTNAPPNTQCSQPQEKCMSNSDCCDSTNVCVGGFCTIQTPK